MVRVGEIACPLCGGKLAPCGRVKRILRSGGHKDKAIDICKVKCLDCGHTHRVLPDEVVPYKQYEADVIQGVLEGLITSSTLGYEDYPTELTMRRWRLYFKSQKFPG